MNLFKKKEQKVQESVKSETTVWKKLTLGKCYIERRVTETSTQYNIKVDDQTMYFLKGEDLVDLQELLEKIKSE